MPRGVVLVDARRQLLDAAERLIRRDGPGALSSRAVTTEAGCAKGVLHHHFADFDALLAELVDHRIDLLGAIGRSLMAKVGTDTVGTNLTVALAEIFDSTASTAGSSTPTTPRDESPGRARRRRAATGFPSPDDAGALLAEYLAAERAAGRLDHGADERLLAFMLIGGARMLFADGRDRRPDPTAIATMTRTVIGVD